MNENGRKYDILIQEITLIDPATGVKFPSGNSFNVWADAELIEKIRAVDGVSCAFVSPVEQTNYIVYVDARYDMAAIKAEVYAALMNAMDQ